ncbi:MAG: proton-conducting transporter membrane subunit, partial [Planctomycetota bacterium]|nr:proton-conducting transporter membrane subunit [Planctomycetota bacterium]
LGALSVGGAVYGGLMAMAQDDFKRLIAYSSVSHMGVCMLGITSMNLIGVQGALFVMLSHGLTAAGLFLLAGMLYERGHTREMAAYGGLASRMPIFSTVFVIVGLGAIGVPLTSGFVGEFCTLQGAFLWDRKAAVLAGISVVLSCVYILWMIRRIFFGKPPSDGGSSFHDATSRELSALLPIAILIVAMGVAPGFFMDRMEPSVRAWITGIRGRIPVPAGSGAASAPVRMPVPSVIGKAEPDREKSLPLEPVRKPPARSLYTQRPPLSGGKFSDGHLEPAWNPPAESRVAPQKSDCRGVYGQAPGSYPKTCCCDACVFALSDLLREVSGQAFKDYQKPPGTAEQAAETLSAGEVSG